MNHQVRGATPHHQTPYAQKYAQTFNYQQQNPANMTMTPQPFPEQTIQQYAEAIFVQFDLDRSGDIDMMEFPRMLTAFYQKQNLQRPDTQTINYLMATYDYNHDGRLSWQEWNEMLKHVGGHSQMPPVQQQVVVAQPVQQQVVVAQPVQQQAVIVQQPQMMAVQGYAGYQQSYNIKGKKSHSNKGYKYHGYRGHSYKAMKFGGVKGNFGGFKFDFK